MKYFGQKGRFRKISFFNSWIGCLCFVGDQFCHGWTPADFWLASMPQRRTARVFNISYGFQHNL